MNEELECVLDENHPDNVFLDQPTKEDAPRKQDVQDKVANQTSKVQNKFAKINRAFEKLNSALGNNLRNINNAMKDQLRGGRRTESEEDEFIPDFDYGSMQRMNIQVQKSPKINDFDANPMKSPHSIKGMRDSLNSR